MTTLLEYKELIKKFYAKYDKYVNTVIKFVMALLSFLMINRKIGFMVPLARPMVAVVLALVCAFLPLNGMVVVGGILVLGHAYALSLETCLVSAGLLIVMYLLYFRISSRMAILLIITPIFHMLGIPYAVPFLGGILFGPGAAVPASCGTVIFYLLNYMSKNSTSLSTEEVIGGGTKAASLIESMISNKEMFLCITAMILTTLVVYFIRKMSIDHSWELAIGIGTVVNIVLHLLGALLPEVKVRIAALLLGSIVSAAVAFVVKFFVFSVDYTRTERVQFEDDEYYYYVKAIPKNVVPEQKKTVKKIVTQKRTAKTVKRIDS